MKVCTDCKKTGQCGMELDAKLEGMEVTFCARKEQINTKNIKLKRCPFCGGEAVERYDNIHRLYIECKHGCVRTAPYWSNHVIVIETWNTRKPIQNIVEQLEETKTKSYVTGITANPYEFGACHAMNDAIKIVKKEGEV